MNKKNNALRIAVGAILSDGALVASAPVYSCAAEPYIGSICITAASFCPANTHMAAQGQTLPISQYTTLFSLLGTTYGGNGTTSFALPDMRGRTPVGAGQGPGLQPVKLGQIRGVDYLTLTDQQLPSHNHAATFTGDTVAVKASTNNATTAQAGAGDYLASSSALGGTQRYIPATDAGTTVDLGGVSGGGGTVQVNNNGGSQPFANYSPQQALTYCIAVTGVYPSRP